MSSRVVVESDLSGFSSMKAPRSERPRATHSQMIALKAVLCIPDLDATAKASIQEYLDRVRLFFSFTPTVSATTDSPNPRVEPPSLPPQPPLMFHANVRKYSRASSQTTISTDPQYSSVIPHPTLSQSPNTRPTVIDPWPLVLSNLDDSSFPPCCPPFGLHEPRIFTRSPFGFVPGPFLMSLQLPGQQVIPIAAPKNDFLAPPPTHHLLPSDDAQYGPMREKARSYANREAWPPARQVDPVVDVRGIYDLHRSRQLDEETKGLYWGNKEESGVGIDQRRLLQSSDGTLSFLLLSKLGQGSYGKVMLAWCRELDRRVAVKVLHKQAYEEWNGGHIVELELEVMKSVTQLFEQEQAGGSAFLLKVLKSWQDKTNVFFVLDHYSHDMKSLTARRLRIPLSDIRLYAAELVLALESLHGLRILHRDIKPENILISPTGHVCLADFGLAKSFPRLKIKNLYKRALKSYDRAGTSGYMAPEIIKEYNPATRRLSHGSGVEADVWSLGVTLLELFIGTGRSLFDGDDSLSGLATDQKEEIWDSNVEHMPLELEKWVDDFDARDLFGQMLDRNPTTRATLKQIKDHPFFECLDWKKVARREYTPQYIPPYVPASLEPFPSCAFSTFYNPGIRFEDISLSYRTRLAYRNLRKMQIERGELKSVVVAVEWSGKMVLDALHETVASNARPVPIPRTLRRALKWKPVPVFKRWFESLDVTRRKENMRQKVQNDWEPDW